MSAISREKGDIFCPIHSKKKLVFLCKQCDILICNKCMVNEHSGHPVKEVEEVAEKKFRKIDKLIGKIEGTIIPSTKTNAEEVEAQANTRVKELEDGIEKAYQQEKYLIELVRKITKETVGELKVELRTLNQDLFQFKSESDTHLDDLKSAANECKESKKTKNDILIIDVVNSANKLRNNPPICQILQTRKNFTPGSNPVVEIEKAFGCVSTDREASVGFHDSEEKPKPVYPSHEKTPDLNSKGATAPIKLKRKLLSKPLVTHCNDLRSPNSSSIEKFRGGKLCYCCKGKPYIYLIRELGDVKEVSLDVEINDIAIHPTTDVLYAACPNDNSIRSVNTRTGATSIVFTTVRPPHCMAFNTDGTILLGFFITKRFAKCNKVVHYALGGEELKSVNIDTPSHISVCAVTGNIVIATVLSGTKVINQDFQSVFVYRGPPTEKQQNKEAFNCLDAVFDNEGHILVGDCNNKEVHVVDATTGKHRRTINSDKFGRIISLCLNQDGDLAVGTFQDNKIVFVRYLHHT